MNLLIRAYLHARLDRLQELRAKKLNAKRMLVVLSYLEKRQMKKLGILGAMLLATNVMGQRGLVSFTLPAPKIQAPVLQGGVVKLAWQKSPSSDVAGYRVYYGTNYNKYNNAATAGNVTNVTLSGLEQSVSYYFAAVSYTTNGVESVYSNTVTNYIYPKLEIVVDRFKIRVQVKPNTTNIWQVSTNNTTWTSVQTNITGGMITLLRTNNGSQEYIRLK